MCSFLRSKKSIWLSVSLYFANKTRAFRNKRKCTQTNTVLSFQQKTVRSREKYEIILKFNYFWVPPGINFRPIVFLIFINDLPKSNSIKNILFADDTVLVQSDNNLGKLQNSVNHEMTKVMDWLTANKLFVLERISPTKPPRDNGPVCQNFSLLFNAIDSE